MQTDTFKDRVVGVTGGGNGIAVLHGTETVLGAGHRLCLRLRHRVFDHLAGGASQSGKDPARTEISCTQAAPCLRRGAVFT